MLFYPAFSFVLWDIHACCYVSAYPVKISVLVEVFEDIIHLFYSAYPHAVIMQLVVIVL